MAAVHAVVLAGGKGTRFWPLSRAARPKQLLSIVGDRTMVEETVARLEGFAASDHVWIVTGRDHAEAIRAQLPDLSAERILAEPTGRNTAPAVGLAALRIAVEDPEATMVVLPADHHVTDPAGFQKILERAAALASTRSLLVTIGIEPSGPETGYGYIERGEALADGAFTVARFTEKPDRERAEAFVASGCHFWNAGIFVWSVPTILEAFSAHLPEMLATLREVVAAGADADRVASLYSSLESISIDYGVLERARNVAVVPGRFGWDDVGSWGALEKHLAKDEHGNATLGRAVAIDSRGNVVVGKGRVVALLGVEGLVVVETEDAVLVAPRDRAQDVRRVIEELERRGWKDVL